MLPLLKKNRKSQKTRETDPEIRKRAHRRRADHDAAMTPAQRLPQAREHRPDPTTIRQTRVMIIRAHLNNGTVRMIPRGTDRVESPSTQMRQHEIVRNQPRKEDPEPTQEAQPTRISSSTTGSGRIRNVRLLHNPRCAQNKSPMARSG